MNGQTTSFNAHPYSIKEIPHFKIDYKNLIKYAHSVGKKVTELSDKEKEQFITGNTMDDVRKACLK